MITIVFRAVKFGWFFVLYAALLYFSFSCTACATIENNTGKTKYYIIENIPRDGMEKLFYVTLQGLANRGEPRLYLLGNKSTDGHWVMWYEKYGMVGENITLQQALAMFSPLIKGAYKLGDQDQSWEVPIAVTLAGLNDRVLVTPEQAAEVKKAGLRVDPLPIPRFSSRLEAMSWSFANLRKETSPEWLFSYSKTNHWMNIDISDLVVANRGFCFALTTNFVTHLGERQLLGEIYRQSPEYSWVLGWHQDDDGECSYIDFVSRYGLLPVCTINNLNFSFHRYVKARDQFKQKVQNIENLSFEKDKSYVTFVFSDGDAPHSMVDLQKRQWTKPERGTFPFGWAVPPAMLVFGPAMLEYYYKTLTPQDELICGPSGIAYTYLSCWRSLRDTSNEKESPDKEYFRKTNDLLNQLDLHIIWPINRIVEWMPDGRIMRRILGNNVWLVQRPNNEVIPEYGADFMDDAVIFKYCTELPGCFGFFQGWNTIPKDRTRIINGRPYFPSKVLGESPDQTIKDIEEVVRIEGGPTFIPVHINCYTMQLSDIKETVDMLDKTRFKVVLPGEFLRLAAKASGQ